MDTEKTTPKQVTEQDVPTVTITQTQTVSVELPEEHQVLETPADQPDEFIVYDRDETGNVIGWHKEVVNG